MSAGGSRAPFVAKPIQTASAAGQIAQQLREAILTDQLTPGQRLPSEADLAADYAVSRGTIRETLKLLSAQGLVESARGASGGTFVRHPDPSEMAASLADVITLWFNAGSATLAQVNAARAWIERGCVVMASQAATEDDVVAIRAPVDAMERPGVDIDEMLALDLEFHDAVSRAARNPVMEMAMSALHIVRPYTNAMLGPMWDIPTIATQHRAIMDAIVARDADGAAAAFDVHMTYLHEVGERALANRRAEDIRVTTLGEARPAVPRRAPR